MTPSDRKRFGVLLGVLQEVFGSATEPLSEVKIVAYYQALADYDLASIDAAVQRAVKTARYFPRPVELREWAWEALEERRRKQRALAPPREDRSAEVEKLVRDVLERLKTPKAKGKRPA